MELHLLLQDLLVGTGSSIYRLDGNVGIGTSTLPKN
jgi:hypothetical protein